MSLTKMSFQLLVVLPKFRLKGTFNAISIGFGKLLTFKLQRLRKEV